MRNKIMKDGFATVYVEWDDLRTLIVEKGFFQDDAMLVIGRPSMPSPETGEIEFEVAFSETDVHPDEWASKKEEVDKIHDSWIVKDNKEI
jgi:hypothetical protein